MLIKKSFLRGTLAALLINLLFFTVSCTTGTGIITPTDVTQQTIDQTATGSSSDSIIQQLTTSLINVTAQPMDETPTITDDMATTAPASVIKPANSSFKVYFLDVGQADSALILCDGQSMLIDGGNVEDSSLVYAFLKKHDIKHLNYIVGTHAHEDHIGGLAGALNYATVDTIYCPVTDYDTKAFNGFKSYSNKQGVQITMPKAGQQFKLGSAEIHILGPVNEYSDVNNTSIVMRITYGGTSFLFTGDAERESEADILAAGFDLNSTVLKVGHHGSNSSTSYPFLREIMPQHAVISVGKDNSYGHPDEDALSRLRDADVTVYRTDLQGIITCESDGKDVTFTTEKNATTLTNPTAAPEVDNTTAATSITYIGNKNSHKFHLPTCRSLPDDKNRIYLDSRQEAISEGYEPCKICRP